MAVFTHISLEQINNLISNLDMDIGTALELKEISSGIENSNYFLTTTKTEYVLTIFERLNKQQLPFYLNLMLYLAQNNLSVPLPIQNKQQQILHTIADKPMAIVSKLAGFSPNIPNLKQVKAIAIEMARMHGLNNFSMYQANLRSMPWWQEVIPSIINYLKEDERYLLLDTFNQLKDFFNSSNYNNLPQGICHCDLFRDNSLFTENKLNGIFDFYFAGIDKYIFDICVTINDWCINYENCSIIQDKYHTFIDSYQTIKKLTELELKLIPIMLQAAAFRFWLSRLWDWYLPRSAHFLKPHDPNHFKILLTDRLNNAKSYQL